MDRLVKLPTGNQLSVWRAAAKSRYPDFDLILQTRQTPLGWEYSIHFQTLATAPKVKPGALFSLQPFWYPIELLWREHGQSELDYLFSIYPDQSSFRAFTVEQPSALKTLQTMMVCSAAALSSGMLACYGGLLLMTRFWEFPWEPFLFPLGIASLMLVGSFTWAKISSQAWFGTITASMLGALIGAGYAAIRWGLFGVFFGFGLTVGALGLGFYGISLLLGTLVPQILLKWKNPLRYSKI
ncbi:MAG: hypothetical protein WCA07_13040 [Gloeobacterales cyanobacterium]